jgi:hypothetical protein
MAYSGGDRSHTKGHVIEPMQPELAEAVRPASCKTRSRRACPCPVCCAHCTSVTQLDEPRYVRLYRATVVADGRPGALRSEDMQDTPGALLQAASGSHSGLLSRSDRTNMVTRSRATAGGVPDASLLLPAGRVLPVCTRNMRLATTHRKSAGRGCPVLKVTCEHLDARVPLRRCRMWRELSAHKAGPPICDQCQL